LQDKSIFKPIPARKSTRSVLDEAAATNLSPALQLRDNVGATG
jgi:hypothetical protein